MRARIRKWGNSPAIRIPAAVMRSMRLEPDEIVDVREEAGRVVIEPVRKKVYDLGELLAGITSKNQPEIVDSGPPVGKEIW